MPIPDAESLANTTVRVRATWEDTIAPALRAGRNVMVVAHGNTLRALVKLVDDVSEAKLAGVEAHRRWPRGVRFGLIVVPSRWFHEQRSPAHALRRLRARLAELLALRRHHLASALLLQPQRAKLRARLTLLLTALIQLRAC